MGTFIRNEELFDQTLEASVNISIDADDLDAFEQAVTAWPENYTGEVTAFDPETDMVSVRVTAQGAGRHVTRELSSRLRELQAGIGDTDDRVPMTVGTVATRWQR